MPELQAYRYLHLDVFTDTPLTGNQLVVFLDPRDLTTEQMMALSREMGYSETTFVFPPTVAQADFRVRIFALNLDREIPVAGHPSIGTIFGLAAQGLVPHGRRRVVLELGIGPTPFELQWAADRLQFVWMEQLPPELSPPIADMAAVAAALSIREDDIRSTGLPVQQVSCGAPFLMVPITRREIVDRAVLHREAMGSLIDAAGLIRRGVMVFSTETGEDGATAYARMLGFGVAEDPATGNANGPLGCYLVHHGVVSPERARHMTNRQGVKMGRPSTLHVSVESDGHSIQRVRIGGSAVLLASGVIELPG
ncbi:MAG: PhzF family phenazine biosynthesis protein [Chloroflexota bacterium]